MANSTENVKTVIMQQPENQIFEASNLYRKLNSPVPELSYYKTLERMVKAGELVHLAKGMYYRPKKSRFGKVPIGEKEIIDYFTSGNNGLVVGYRLYESKGLTTQVSKKIELLSTSVREQKKNINNISISKINMILSPEVKRMIEAFEILQNYNGIEDMNQVAFASFMTRFAREYTDDNADYVITHRKYKKATIAFMKRCLDFCGVANGLEKYLSSLSEYKIPDLETIYAVT